MEHEEQISPELALVDPELRARGVLELLQVESTRVWAPYAPVRLPRPEPQHFALPRRRPPLAVAATVYLAVGILQVALWGAVLMGALVISIAAAVLFS
jgi:hypothetical protein